MHNRAQSVKVATSVTQDHAHLSELGQQNHIVQIPVFRRLIRCNSAVYMITEV